MNRKGIIRRVDPMGRVVLPIELRLQLIIEDGAKLGISVSGGCVILTKTLTDRKWVGYTRTVDTLGRVVLPADLRRTLGIREGDQLEIFGDGDMLVLAKFDAGQVREECCDRMISNLDGLSPEIKGKVYTLISKIRALIIPEQSAAQEGGHKG